VEFHPIVQDVRELMERIRSEKDTEKGGGWTPQRLRSILTEIQDRYYQNHYDWDLWNFTSSEGTVPAASTAYTIYAIVKAGSTERLARFHHPTVPTAKTVTFTHDSYVAPILPAKDVTVGPELATAAGGTPRPQGSVKSPRSPE
jgi:hypothetical protein